MVNRRNFLGTLLAPAFVPRLKTSSAALVAPAGNPSVPPFPDESDPQYWDRIRDMFYIRRGEAYFNTATLGATPRPVLERVIEDMRVNQETITRWDYTANTQNLISGYSPEVPLREKLGKLINASADDIALTQNATFGMNFVSQGIDLKPGDEIISTNQEHPGGVCGWQERAKRSGAVCKQITMPVPANDPDQIVQLFAEQITPRTRVLAYPHIISATAVVMPVQRLTELAHKHGCLSVVDGAQAIGQVELDMKKFDCDAYFASPHKWLLAPAGNGFLYIRRDRQDQIWTTLASAEWDDHKSGMYRFMQYGTGNPSLQVGLDAALDFHFRIGPERVRQRIRSLADRLRSGLQQIPKAAISSPVHPDLAGAVVVYKVDGVPAQKLLDAMWQGKGLRPRSMGDGLGMRHSCAIYNNEAEIDASLDVVRTLAKGA